MNKRWIALPAIAFALLLAPLTVAAEGQYEYGPTGSRPGLMYQSEMLLNGNVRAESVTGYAVFNQRGNRIGSVEDLLHDLHGGFAIFVVVSFDETQFAGNSYPVPLSYLIPQLDQEAFRLNIAETDILEYAPTMEGYAADLPSTTEWSREVSRFWSQSAAAPTNRAPLGSGVRTPASGYFYNPASGMRVFSGPLLRQSGLTGQTVYDENGNTIGSVTGTIVNVGNGVIPYVLTRAQEGQAVYPLPLSLFTYETLEERLMLSVAQQWLQDAPQYQAGNAPNFTSQDWNQTVRSYWINISKIVRYRNGLRVTPAEVFQVETLTGYAVVNSERQSLGRIADFLITQQGRVPYAVVEFAGFLGLGGRRYAIPMSVMELSTALQQVFLDLDRNQLEQMAPLGDVNYRQSGRNWDQEIRSFWQDQLAQALGEFATGLDEEEAADPPAQLATSVRGYTVMTSDGSSVGSVDSLLISVEDARLRHGVVLASSTINREDANIPVPLDLVPWQITGDTLRLNVPASALRNAPAFDFGDWPLRSRPGWDSQIRSYWQNR